VSSKFKNWIIGKICAACGERNQRIWDDIYQFDRDYSWEYELWQRQDEALNEACTAARKLGQSDAPADQAASLVKLLELSDAGHPFAMLSVGSRYQKGIGVEKDLKRAAEYYRESLNAGSWLATLYYAGVMYQLGNYEKAFDVLESNVRNKHSPSFFWLAHYRFKRKKSRKVAREIRPLLEYLHEFEHQGARTMLNMLQVLGFYGLREIMIGWKGITAPDPAKSDEARKSEAR